MDLARKHINNFICVELVRLSLEVSAEDTIITIDNILSKLCMYSITVAYAN